MELKILVIITLTIGPMDKHGLISIIQFGGQARFYIHYLRKGLPHSI